MCELIPFFFNEGLHLQPETPPHQLCVEIRNVLCIKTHTHLLSHIHLQAAGILADIFFSASMMLQTCCRCRDLSPRLHSCSFMHRDVYSCPWLRGLQSSECYPPVSEPGRCFHITISRTLSRYLTTDFHGSPVVVFFYVHPCGVGLMNFPFYPTAVAPTTEVPVRKN